MYNYFFKIYILGYIYIYISMMYIYIYIINTYWGLPNPWFTAGNKKSSFFFLQKGTFIDLYDPLLQWEWTGPNIYISNLFSAKIAGGSNIPVFNMQKMHLQKGPFSRQLCQFTECTGVYIHH